jgi:serine phosphatase RsbU (regulator of sigma subunit)
MAVVTGELAAAKEVQALMLQTDAATPGFTVDAVYRPAQEVGGDFYQVWPGDDGTLIAVVGDVSGKGLKAAMMVASVVGAIRNERGRSPGSLLEYLNRSIAGHTGGGFITCCALRWERNGRVTVANAGHLAPYLGGREVEIESGLPLGITGEATYRETTFAAEDQTMTILSDGVVEAANPNHELFGFERTREISGRSANEIAEAAKAWGQNDDITVVTVRRAG